MKKMRAIMEIPNSLRMIPAVAVTLGWLMTGCATTSTPLRTSPENMDVAEIPIADKPDALLVADPGGKVSADAAFNWQHYFKGAPPAKERPALQQAIKQLSSATSSNALLKRGRNEFALGFLAASESSFRQALRQDPKNIDVLIDLAGTLQRQRKAPAALDILAEARSNLSALERPEPSLVFRYRYTLAMTYLANDDRVRAHAILTDLIGKDRTFLPGYAALAFSYLKDGKDSVAKFVTEQALDRGGDHASLYNILGVLAERQGLTGIARDHYNHALTISDTYTPALVNRGNLHVAAHEASMAETDYKKALDADPANIDALIGLGVVQRQTGRFSTAQATFLRAIELDADSPQARFNLAILMRENLKDDGQALRYFTEVTQSEHANPSLKTMAHAAINEIRNL
jgi:Tfp pilus assembly protein PilF